MGHGRADRRQQGRDADIDRHQLHRELTQEPPHRTPRLLPPGCAFPRYPERILANALDRDKQHCHVMLNTGARDTQDWSNATRLNSADGAVFWMDPTSLSACLRAPSLLAPATRETRPELSTAMCG